MAASSSLDAADARSTLADLPPSPKLVATVLDREGELTQSQLAEETRLPTRTVRSSVAELEAAGLVTARNSVVDARMRVYTLEASLEG
jgi:DNA-binding MarR family transcriptional regulator